MARILKKERLSDVVWRYRLDAPRIAKKRKAGQFIILRPSEQGERIPLTIADGSAAEGWIEIIFQVVGKTTAVLAGLPEGGDIPDLAGPLGKPTHVEKFGRCVCIGGGVGIAPLYPIVSALHGAGNDITMILGARNQSLLMLVDEMKQVSGRVIVATDDGSEGFHGFVSAVLADLLGKGETFDLAVVIGPTPMMKVTSKVSVDAGIRTMVSLNPIMVDGTGMCGGCRVTVDGKTKFACVDGPEFDAAKLDWNEMGKRLGTYKQFETEKHNCKVGLDK